MRSSVLWCLALCAAVAGCDKADDGTNNGAGLTSLFDPVAANPSLCGSPAIPYPNNALFSGTTDGTLNIPNPAAAPFVTAANLTDGFSTTASIFTDVLGAVDFTSAGAAVLILEVDGSPRFLTYGEDFTIQPSTAMAQVSGTGHATGTCAASSAPARFLPISAQRSRLLIEPLKPLNPSTTYIVAVTRALKSRDGVPATANEFFPIVNSDTAVSNQTAPVLALLTDTQKGTLETLRSALIRPTVTALKSFHANLRGAPLADSELVIAWSFTTQSIGLSLSRLDTSAAAAAFQVASTTISTGDLGLGLADTADIYAGVLQVPYYLANSGGNVNSTAPLATFWASTGTLNSANPPALGGAVPCSALAKSASTTICYPDPVAQSAETVPVLVAVPNANSGQAKPAGGWPVVIYQHGITRNRTDLLALAPTLAAAGFVTIGLDIPLHGVTNTSSNLAANPFYRNQIFANPAFGGAYNGLITGERTFNLDLVANASGAPGPDNAVDSSGTHFVNLASVITSRDNLRQAEADILHLARSMAALDLDGNAGALSAADIDESRIHFAGQSLGAIVGIPALAQADSSEINAASLHVPGGALGKLLDASASFGPRIAAGLAASFVYEGTDTYETFLRFAQHLIDPADPINYAAAANAGHPIHLVQVIGDTVVPNSAMSTCPVPLPAGLGATATTIDVAGTTAAGGAAGAALVAACPDLVIPADPPLAAITYQDTTVLSGYLSGTDPLVEVMGLSHSVAMGSAPFATQSPAGADTVVVFAPDTAEHGTLLTPDSSAVAGADASFAPATCAMQKQTAAFFASDGALLPIGGACP